MAEQGGQERTEQPTSKRLRDARDKGQLPRSRELSTALLLTGGAFALMLLGSYMIEGMLDVMRGGLSIRREALLAPDALSRQLLESVLQGWWLIAPFLAVTVLLALMAPLSVSGWSFSTKALAFKWDKLDPIKGLQRIFAWRGLVELLKALAKFLLIGGVALLLMSSLENEFVQLGREPLEQALAHSARILLWCFAGLSAAMMLIAAVDVPFQIWDHHNRLKMTRQEIKDELKETEGNPEMKGRLRRMQQEMAQRRMMSEVPKADVIITNPTHYAVALRYDATRMAAPVVVAKGMDLVAAEIRRLATEADVPLVSAPPLSRAIYYSTDLNDAVPSGLFVAVARVLAYVYQVKQAPRYGDSRAGRSALDDLPIPDEYRR